MEIVIPPFLRDIYNNTHFSHAIFSPSMVAWNQKHAYRQLHRDGPHGSAYKTPSVTEIPIVLVMKHCENTNQGFQQFANHTHKSTHNRATSITTTKIESSRVLRTHKLDCFIRLRYFSKKSLNKSNGLQIPIAFHRGCVQSTPTYIYCNNSREIHETQTIV